MQLVKSLSALALLGSAIPSTYALSIKDDTLSVGVKAHVQVRASLLNDGEDATGGNYDPLRNTAGEAEFARFYLRRARFGVSAKYGDWRANFQIRGGESTDKDTASNPTTFGATSNRPIQLYYANVARVFKTGDIEHDIHAGLDKPFNSESSISSTALMFPQERIVGIQIETRNVGVGYGLRSSFVDFGVDVQNNSTATKDPQASNNTGEEEKNGYFYSARVQFSPGKDFKPDKRQESYCGKEGTHIVLGFDWQSDMGNLNDNGTNPASAPTNANYRTVDTTTYGPDLLVHWNFITFLAEYRIRKTETETITDATGASTSTDVDGTFWNAQVGYAFPLEGGTAIEPAIRYGERDDNKDADSTASYGGNADIGASGTQWEVGVSAYFAGHTNKLQLSYQNWEAEEGDATAKIVRLQHQIAF